MGRVVSFIGYLPPPRYDAQAWTGVEVSEAADPDNGPWSVIDTLVFTDEDADPSEPQPRNITTTQATLDDGWYRLVFVDTSNGRSDPSDPARSDTEETELPPSASAIRNMSPLLRQIYPLPPTDDYAIADLRGLVAQSISLVQTATWRLIDPALGDLAPEGYASEAVPAGMVPLAFKAVAVMAERLAVSQSPDNAEMFALGRHLRGFSAGPYSESYFAPGEFARRGAQQSRPAMDQDDALDTVLWALATEDARDYFVFRATGVAPPIGSVTGFDYRRQSLGYGAGEAGGWPGGLGHGGPDGF